MATQVETDPQATAAGHLAVLEDYGAPQQLMPDELQAYQTDGTLPVPAGWSLGSGYRTTLSITIIDQGASGQTLVSTTVPVIRGVLTRGSETLELDVTQLVDGPSKAWATYVEVVGSLQPVPLGQGFSSGPTAVIDRGTSLIRATYDGGTQAELDPAALQTRVHDLLFQFT